VILDRHHLILYGAVAIVAIVGAIGYHLRSVDVAKAEAKAAAQETIVAAAEKRMADRDAETKQTIAALLSQKSTPATTPTQIVERIPTYFPQLQPSLQPQVNPQTGQIDTSKPPNLVFDAPQAKLLNDTLVDCKVCQVERDKVKADLADLKTNVIPAKDKEIKNWRDAAKGGSIWKRVGKVALAAGCAAGGGYAASPRGSKAAAIGAGAGAVVCSLAWR
jgi:hypothetical protein